MSLVNCINGLCLNKERAENIGISYAMNNPTRPVWDPEAQKVYVEIKEKRIYLWTPDQEAAITLKHKKISNDIWNYMYCAIICNFFSIMINSANLKMLANDLNFLFIGMQLKSLGSQLEYINEYAQQAAAKYIKDHHVGPIDGQPLPAAAVVAVVPPLPVEVQHAIVNILPQEEGQLIADEQPIQFQQAPITSIQMVDMPETSTEESLKERLLPEQR